MDIYSSDKCCFCVNLKTGCWIIGILSLFGTMLRLAYHVIQGFPFISCYDNPEWFIAIHYIWAFTNIFEFCFALYFVHGLVVNDSKATIAFMAAQFISVFFCLTGTIILVACLKTKAPPPAGRQDEGAAPTVECPDRVTMSVDKFATVLIEGYLMFMVNSYRVYQKRFRNRPKK